MQFACICGLKHVCNWQAAVLDSSGLTKGLLPCTAAEVPSSAWVQTKPSECRHFWLE